MTKYHSFDTNGDLKQIDKNLMYLYERFVLTSTGDVICLKDQKQISNLSANTNVLRNPLIVSHRRSLAPDGKYYFYYQKHIDKPIDKAFEHKFNSLPDTGEDTPFYCLFHARIVGFDNVFTKDEVNLMDKFVVINNYSISNTFDKKDNLKSGNCYIFLLSHQENKIIDVLYDTTKKAWVNKKENIFI